MKPARATKFVFATAVVAMASLLLASPASASTVVGSGTFYGASDFGAETSSGYPTGVDWFFGQVSGTEGPHNFGQNGLELNADTSGVVQILNQNVGTQPATAADFITLAETFEINSSNNSVWALQLPFFGDSAGNTEFTTLVPTFLGNYSGTLATTIWRTTWAIPGHYAANDTAAFSDLVDALYDGAAPRLLAYGLWLPATDTVTVQDVQFGGTHSFFMPAPTRAISATSLTQAAASTTGFTLSGTGWEPGSFAFIHIEDAAGNVLYDDDSTFQVDASGNISAPIVLPSSVPVGTLTITFDDDGYFYNNDVFGDPFTTLAITAALAETGAPETGPYFAGAAGLLALVGITTVVVTRRRMQKI